MPVQNKQKVRVELISVLSPPEQWVGEKQILRSHNEQTAALLLEKRKIRDAISNPVRERLRTERILKLTGDEQSLLRAGGCNSFPGSGAS